jgi:hypothetical protein
MSGCTFFAANIYYTPVVGPPSPYVTNTFEWRGPSLMTGIFLLSLGLAVLWSRRRGNMGFVVGALIGAGVMGLIDGICFIRSW